MTLCGLNRYSITTKHQKEVIIQWCYYKLVESRDIRNRAIQVVLKEATLEYNIMYFLGKLKLPDV